MYTSDMWSFEHTANFFFKISYINKTNIFRTHTSTLGIRGYKKNLKSKLKVTHCQTNFIQQSNILELILNRKASNITTVDSP